MTKQDQHHQQHLVHDDVAIRYAGDVDHVWAGWHDALERCERALRLRDVDPEDVPELLRRAQYRAHTTSEFAAGLVPPPSAAEAHHMLTMSLMACRDALGVLAIRAQLDELDDDLTDIGLHALDTTRDAFHGARTSTSLVQAWVLDDRVDASWLHVERPASSVWNAVMWGVVAMCAALLLMVAVQVLSTLR